MCGHGVAFPASTRARGPGSKAQAVHDAPPEANPEHPACHTERRLRGVAMLSGILMKGEQLSGGQGGRGVKRDTVQGTGHRVQAELEEEEGETVVDDAEARAKLGWAPVVTAAKYKGLRLMAIARRV